MEKKYTIKRFNGKKWVQVNPNTLPIETYKHIIKKLREQSLTLIKIEDEIIIVEQLDKESKVNEL